MLTFGKGNAKLVDTYTFSLPAGWTCPGADACKAKANRETGKITDGARQEFRCFAASMEARLPSVRNSRWSNFDALQATESMADLILASLPKQATRVRIHVSGDFFSRAYLDAWIAVAGVRPGVTFYAYTKSVHLLPERATLPSNLRIVVSAGMRHELTKARALGYSVAFVRFVDDGTLPIDHDDSHAIAADHDFALLLHGAQPTGSDASRALQELKRAGFGGYGK